MKVDRTWFAEEMLKALPADHGLTPLPRFDPDPRGLSGVVKVFFGARCECGTAAVLSVESNATKSRAEVIAATPSLVLKVLAQRDAFRRMPCAAHKKLQSRG